MNRKSLIILVLLSVSSGIIAQNVDDALRYSQIFYGGTARFMSMGGAFTALGGDLSSLSQNPAGLGVFRASEFTITPQLFHINTSARFNGNASDYLYNFNLGQVGIVSNIISKSGETGLLSLNFGYSFNKTNNLNQNILIKGISNKSSMADLWADEARGSLHSQLETNVPDAFLAYDTFVIDTLSGSNTQYGTVYSRYGDEPPSVYGQLMRRFISLEGYTGEHAISIAGNYSNKLFFGATLGIHSLKYTSHYEHLESTDVALGSKFENFTYTEHFENHGTGYSLKIGAIIKPIETLRIGLAFHSPTIYRIFENYYDNMTSNFNITNGHSESSNPELAYNYRLITPFRALAGIAYQIKKIGLLSADYEFVDYSIARFRQTGDGFDYTFKNNLIKNSLKATSNIRLGGELRLNKLYLRTGYGYYGKAFKPGDDNQNLDYTSISFGAGFREKNISVDFGYTNYSNSRKYILYDSSVEKAMANLDINRDMFTVSIGYKFGY